MDLEQLLQLLTPNETALTFLTRKHQKPLYTGIDPLDQCSFSGSTGIQPGDIVEIYGNQGCGASQLCLTACLNCIMPLVTTTTKSQSRTTRENEEELLLDGEEHLGANNLIFRHESLSSGDSGQYNVLFFDMDFKFDEVQLVQMLEERIYVIVMAQIQEKRARIMRLHPENAIGFDQVVSQQEYDEHFATIFTDDDDFSKFVHDTISRVKVIRPQNAFAFWMTIESLLSVGKETVSSVSSDNISAAASSTIGISANKSPYGCIIVDSLTSTFSHKSSYQKRDWDKACEALVRLTKFYDIPLFATVRELFPKESRRSYRREALQQNERNRQYLSEDQRTIEEMYIIHREVMPNAWREGVKYRLLLDADERATHNGFLAALCPIVSNATAFNKIETKPIRPSKLYRFQIANHGVTFDQEEIDPS